MFRVFRYFTGRTCRQTSQAPYILETPAARASPQGLARLLLFQEA